jgi:hypothetical protein
MFKNSIYMLGNEFSLSYGKQYIKNIKSFQEVTEDCGILLINQKKYLQNKTLQKLHKNKNILKWLVFVKAESSLSPYLSDGKINFKKIKEQTNYLQNKLALIKNEDVEPLFLWLWLNPERRLKPLKNIQNKNLYEYPLIDLYYPKSSLPYAFLVNETQKNNINKQKLVDRVRNCPSCQSAFINYVETCPNCSSINIIEESSLHCFSCGEVNKQKLFLRNNKIQCPNCLTNLKHIGVDYDRPIEQFHCNDCQHSFSDQLTKANCLHCEEIFDINSLITRNIYDYSIGEQSDNYIKHGFFRTAPDFNINSKVSQEYFVKMIDWVNKIAIRHNQKHLLITLHIKNYKEVLDHIGEIEIINVIEEISQRLNTILRTTDICCQFNESTLLLFFPMVEKNELPILQNKLTVLENIVEYDIHFDSQFFTLPEKHYQDDFDFWITSIIGGYDE